MVRLRIINLCKNQSLMNSFYLLIYNQFDLCRESHLALQSRAFGQIIRIKRIKWETTMSNSCLVISGSSSPLCQAHLMIIFHCKFTFFYYLRYYGQFFLLQIFVRDLRVLLYFSLFLLTKISCYLKHGYPRYLRHS